MKRAAVQQPSEQPRKRRCATIKKRDDMHCCPVCMNVLTPPGCATPTPSASALVVCV